jgi:hypothetical protein
MYGITEVSPQIVDKNAEKGYLWFPLAVRLRLTSLIWRGFSATGARAQTRGCVSVLHPSRDRNTQKCGCLRQTN